MKKKFDIRYAILAITLLYSFQDMIAQDNEEHILWQKIDTFNQAFKEGDIEELKSMITENYLHTNSTSKPIDKNTWIAYLAKRKKDIASGNLVVHRYEMQEKFMRLYDDMAIISAKIITSSSRDGNLVENQFRVTNIWVKEENNWKRAGFHDGKIK